MAKKLVRGVIGVDDIEKFDKTLTNVNDLLSDGQSTYVHTKKGNTEKYVNITDNVKSISSVDTDLMEVSIDENSNATVKPKHDEQKEQTIQSDDGTLLINNGANDTSEKTNIRVNPTKVLLQGQISSGTGINVQHQESWWGTEINISDEFIATVNNKQNAITNNESIAVSGTGLRQLYTQNQTYNVSGGLLKTHVKSVADNTAPDNSEEEFNFIAKIDKGVASVNFTLNEHDTTKFTTIIETYGQTNTVRISGFVFTLSDSTLTVSATNNANQNYVITFSDII